MSGERAWGNTEVGHMKEYSRRHICGNQLVLNCLFELERAWRLKVLDFRYIKARTLQNNPHFRENMHRNKLSKRRPNAHQSVKSRSGPFRQLYVEFVCLPSPRELRLSVLRHESPSRLDGYLCVKLRRSRHRRSWPVLLELGRGSRHRRSRRRQAQGRSRSMIMLATDFQVSRKTLTV